MLPGPNHALVAESEVIREGKVDRSIIGIHAPSGPNHALVAESEVMHEGKVDRDVKVCIFQIQLGEPLPFLKVFEN